MPEIRRMTTEDLLQFYKIHTIAYNMRRDYAKEENQKIDPLDHPASWAWGSFEGGALLAGMYDLDFLMRFDGHSVKMSGVGGVGTLPQARNNGHVRRILEKFFPDAYERGVVFSTLTPFDHDFYRKFGYEVCCARNNITINMGDLCDIEAEGEFVHIQHGDDTSLLAEVHSAYIANINHGIHRDNWADNRAWKRFTREDSCAAGCFLYLWKDENGKARSYIKYQDVTEDGDHNMSVYELAFVDKKGLYGALSIISGLSAQYENFKWLAPSFIDPFDLTGDAWSVEAKILPREMTRIINVKTALELMRRPLDANGNICEGEYVIEVEDENISANSGKYLVQFGKEGAKVSAAKKKGADISCGIHTLNQLVTGYRTLENAMYSRAEGLEVHGNEATLKSVFTERPQHVTEYY